ncbi:MAG TPA: heme-binding domain-containing protein [Pyrinomonadaceae bacterium]
MVRRILKWLAVVVAVVFVCIQFVRPRMTNAAIDGSRTVGARLRVTPEVGNILARSCNDCHSQQTRFPWYSRVAPVSWLLDDHIREGREHLNFSDWAAYDAEEQDLLLQNTCRLARRGAMPIPSYLYIHRDAKLSEADVKTLCDWTNAERERLGAKQE